jgi:hypothetical protein
MIIIAVIGLTIGQMLESEKTFYENPPVTRPTGSAAEALAWDINEQAENLERVVEPAAHSVHEATVVVELGALLLIAVALFGYAGLGKRSVKKIRSDRIT